MTLAAPGRRWWWRFGVGAAGLTVSVLLVRGRLPHWSSVAEVLAETDLGWLVLAALLHISAMAAAAGQQRHLLVAMRMRMPMAAALSMTYARAAVSIGLPAGSAAAAGYAYRQLRMRGADSHVATAALILCGIASAASLGLLHGADLAVSSVPRAAGAPALAAYGAVIVAVGVTARRVGGRRAAGVAAAAVPGSGLRLGRLGRALASVKLMVRLMATLTVAQWSVVLGLAALNWLADAGCLLASTRAVGVAAPALDVVTAFLAMQVVRQLPLTPGGIGVFDAALVFALVTAGAIEGPAAAAVVLYRLVSNWAVLAAGLSCWMAQQKSRRPVESR